MGAAWERHATCESAFTSYRSEPVQTLRCKQRVETTTYSHLMKKFIAFRGVIKAVFITEPQYKIDETF